MMQQLLNGNDQNVAAYLLHSIVSQRLAEDFPGRDGDEIDEGIELSGEQAILEQLRVNRMIDYVLDIATKEGADSVGILRVLDDAYIARHRALSDVDLHKV